MGFHEKNIYEKMGFHEKNIYEKWDFMKKISMKNGISSKNYL